MLHGGLALAEIYRALQPNFPCDYVRYVAGEVAGKVLVCPPSAIRTRMITQIKARRTAVLTGWALDPGAIYRYQCDAAFPLTDHADYPDLIRYVELVQPKRVLTLHGFAAEFARDLRERGIDAWALSEENQLELTLQQRGETRATKVVEVPTISASAETGAGFARFAQLGEQIATPTTSS